MSDFRFVMLLLLVAVLWGCPPRSKQNNLPEPSVSAADFIEYTKIDNWGKSRVLISAMGAARIDIELDHHCTSYLIAVSVPETQRLIRSGEGLIQTLQSTEPTQGIPECTFRTQHGGRRISLQFFPQEADRHNLLLQGLVSETELVASAALIRAFFYYVYAKEHATPKNYQGLQDYYSAAASFEDWLLAAGQRNPPRLYEPELRFEFHYEGDDGNVHDCRGFALAQIQSLPGMTSEREAKVLAQYLDLALEPFHVTSSDGVLLLTTDMNRLIRADSNLAPEVIKAMKAFGPPW